MRLFFELSLIFSVTLRFLEDMNNYADDKKRNQYYCFLEECQFNEFPLLLFICLVK